MTINISKNVSSYDWSTWMIGIMRSFISGGAGAVTGAATPMVVDPKDWNLGNGFGHVMEAMITGFVIMGVIHMMIFLQTHGAPDQVKPN